ncbi:MAG: hypothetical protein ACQ9MH_11585 [Nitrospinales bacterium]
MRPIFILSIVLVFASAVSPLIAAEPVPPQSDIIENNLAEGPKTPQERKVMTSQEMVNILIVAADESKAVPNMVQLKYKGVELLCIYDVSHDRMRIIASVGARGDITADQIEKAMEANFHSALDARYALNKGILYAAFIHPLSSLTKAQVESGLIQTATLAATFGNQYSSGLLSFGGVGEPL